MAITESISELTTLISATEARAVAASAEYNAQLKAVAYAINTAANTGQTSVMFNRPLRQDVRAELLKQKYSVSDGGLANPSSSAIIDWTEKE